MSRRKPPPPAASLEIRYVRLDQVVRWDANPKRHHEAALWSSISRFGFRDAPIFDGTLGALVAGNGRTKVALAMHDEGEPLPHGVRLESDGMRSIPVQFGIDAKTAAEAVAFAVDHNNLTLGPDAGPFEVARIWDEPAYVAVLAALPVACLPVSVQADDLKILTDGVDLSAHEPKPNQDAAAKAAIFRVVVPAGTDFEAVVEGVKATLADHPEWGATVHA